MERDELTSCCEAMVELRTRRREMGGDGANHHEKLGLEGIWCASQFPIPDTAGSSPDPACNNTDTRSSQPNQASHTPDFSYPLVSSTLFSSSSPISLCLVHNSTIVAEHNVKSSLSISTCHDHELTRSTAYTEYSIHPSTASTQDCLSSLHSHGYKLTPECSFSLQRASLHDRPPSVRSPWELKGKVTLSHSPDCESSNWWIDSQHLACRQSAGSEYSSNISLSRSSKCISKRSWWRPPSSHNDGLQVHLRTRLATISEFISKFTPSRPLILSPITSSKCISKLVWSLP